MSGNLRQESEEDACATIQSISRHIEFFRMAGECARFFCEASGAAVCTVPILPMQPIEAALEEAWRTEGRDHFNRCQKCGKWVADVMYNPNTLECVACSPWEEKPAFCPQCGERVLNDGFFCHRCGRRLQYGEEDAYGGA